MAINFPDSPSTTTLTLLLVQGGANGTAWVRQELRNSGVQGATGSTGPHPLVQQVIKVFRVLKVSKVPLVLLDPPDPLVQQVIKVFGAQGVQGATGSTGPLVQQEIKVFRCYWFHWSYRQSGVQGADGPNTIDDFIVHRILILNLDLCC